MVKRTFFFIFVLIFSNVGFAETKTVNPNNDSRFTFGVGRGLLYSGFGINVGLRSENDFKYISLGCVKYYKETYRGSQSACGPGVGWVWTDIFGESNNKHGFGFYIGPVDARHEWEWELTSGGVQPVYKDLQVQYGTGLSYVYFPRGIDRAGWNMGFSATSSRYRGGFSQRGAIQLGYQF